MRNKTCAVVCFVQRNDCHCFHVFVLVFFCFVLLRAVSLLFNDPSVDFRCTRWQIIEFRQPCCCFVLTRPPLHPRCFLQFILTRLLFIFRFFWGRNFRLPLTCSSGPSSSEMLRCVNFQNIDGLQVRFFKICLSLCFSIRLPRQLATTFPHICRIFISFLCYRKAS
jgi:hypothetical protein